MNRRTFVGMLGLSLAGAVSCRGVPAPAGVSMGHTKCAKCGGIIFSMEGIAQIAYADGTARYYDDLGCMATDLAARSGQGQKYVQLAGGKGWARVEDVAFASSPTTVTARGYGYLAYPEEEARQIAPDHWARGWDDLVAELSKKK